MSECTVFWRKSGIKVGEQDITKLNWEPLPFPKLTTQEKKEGWQISMTYKDRKRLENERKERARQRYLEQNNR